jgi:PPM family protein phosphatase
MSRLFATRISLVVRPISDKPLVSQNGAIARTPVLKEMRLRAGAATDTGLVRNLNEDVFIARADQGLFLVCDGMGGAPAGEVASKIAAETILKELSSDEAASHTNCAEHYLPRTNRLAEAVRRSNHVVYRHAQEDRARAGMGTTMVGAWMKDDIASVAHVGDSRAYLWHSGELVSLTRDHSLVEAHISAGILSREQSRRSPQQNILLRVLGREQDVEVELNEVPMQPGDFLLLCSDGLTHAVEESVMSRAIVELRHPQHICDFLIRAANSNGGADNITVVAVEVRSSLPRRVFRQLKQLTTGGASCLR